MGLNEFKSKVEIMSKMDANHFRSEYIKKFIDTNHEHYKKYIETVRYFSDGECYTGYLWDCLIEYKATYFEEINKYRGILGEVLVFWDIHSKDRILIPEYWKFGKDNVLKLSFEALMNNLQYLPEDIYIFDESFKWTLVLTHEDNNGDRICMKSGL